jgi:hypothetical protein
MASQTSVPKSFDSKMSKLASKLQSLERQNPSKLRKMCELFNQEQEQLRKVEVTGRKKFEKLMNDQAL